MVQCIMDKTIVPIYNLEGNQTNQIEIDDKLVYDRGRVWKGTQPVSYTHLRAHET